VLVTTILVDSVRVWAGLLAGKAPARNNETPFVRTLLASEEF
jgi:hypothetical protein